MNISITQEFKVVECCNCHIPFAITIKHNNELLQSKETFYCPNGHPQSYVGESYQKTIERLSNSLEICKNDKTDLYKRIRNQQEIIEKDVKVKRALKMNIARMKKYKSKHG